MDISQIKVSNIKLIEEEPKLKEIEVSNTHSFTTFESEKLCDETVPYVSGFRNELSTDCL